MLHDVVSQTAGLFQVKLIQEECGNPNIGLYDERIEIKLPGKRKVKTLDGGAKLIQRRVLQDLNGKAPSNVLVVINPFHRIRWEEGSTYMRFASSSVIRWAPHILARVAQVLSGIRNECGSEDLDLNGVHLRLEGDAGPWLGKGDFHTRLVKVPLNKERVSGWMLYLEKLIQYGMLAPGKPLYLATGLFMSKSEDPFAATLLDMITANLTAVRLFGST